MKVLAISGSLRQASINTALLRAAVGLAPPTMSIEVCALVGELPLFNPDLEHCLPVSVSQFYAAIAATDALLIASPEYAHGVTGAIKNMLDWLVGFPDFVHKPVAVLNAAPRAHHADAALRETLVTMSAIIVESASVTLPLRRTNMTERKLPDDLPITNALRTALAALAGAVAARDGRRCVSFPIE